MEERERRYSFVPLESIYLKKPHHTKPTYRGFAGIT
jgi:hypothetical protein